MHVIDGEALQLEKLKPSASWGSPKSGCSVWGASEAGWQCAFDKTFAEAEAICQAAGARLCTAAELVDGCTSGSGCGFDSQLVWAVPTDEDHCLPSPPPPLPRRRRPEM